MANLLRRAREGDESAFEVLVKMYYERTYKAALAILGNEHDAEDAAQQAWVKAWRKLGQFREDSDFGTWVYRIALNTAKDLLRQRVRKAEDPLPPADAEGLIKPVYEPPPSVVGRPDYEAERHDRERRFKEALGRLSPDHRLALVLREVEGLSYQEIANVMKCRIGTVMSRLHYARRRLAELMRSS